jgi:beta-phosphoglucomutase-like phosphatase (HAD superfamily)
VAYKLVIFDFDGTLADSAGWLFGVLNQVADSYGFRRVGGRDRHAARPRQPRDHPLPRRAGLEAAAQFRVRPARG